MNEQHVHARLLEVTEERDVVVPVRVHVAPAQVAVERVSRHGVTSPSAAGEPAVGDAVQPRRLDTEPFDLVRLVGREVSLEPEPPRRILVVALVSEHVRRDAVEEPAVMRHDHGAARELQQRVL